MNLHALVRSSIQAVNPDTYGTLRQSRGYSTADDGSQVPYYMDPIDVYLQVQPISTGDLEKLDGMNIQGELWAVYLNGRNWDGIVRADRRGGDMLTFFGHQHLVVNVLEQWPDWCKLAVVRQIHQP